MEPYTLSTLHTLIGEVLPHIKTTGPGQEKEFLRAQRGLLGTALKTIAHPEFEVPAHSAKLMIKLMLASQKLRMGPNENDMLKRVRLELLRKTQPWQKSGEGMGKPILPLCLEMGDAAAVTHLLTCANAPSGATLTAQLIPRPDSPDAFGLLPGEVASITPVAYCLLSMPTNESALTHTDALLAMAQAGVDLQAPLTDLGHHAWDFVACGQTLMALAQAGVDWNGRDDQGRSRLAQVFNRTLPTDRVVGMIQATQALHEEGRLPHIKELWPELVVMFGQRLSSTWTASERETVDLVEAMTQLSLVTGLSLGRQGTQPTLMGTWALNLLKNEADPKTGVQRARLENYPALDKLSCVRNIPKRMGIGEEGIPDGVWVAMVRVHHQEYVQGKSFSRAALNELMAGHSIEEAMEGFAKAFAMLGPTKPTWKALTRLRSALPNRFWEQQVRQMTQRTVEMFDQAASGDIQNLWRSSGELMEFTRVASEIFKPLAQGTPSPSTSEDIDFAARLNLWVGWPNQMVQSGFERWANQQTTLDTQGLMRTMEALQRHGLTIGGSPESQALFRSLVLHNNLTPLADRPRKAPRF